MADSTDRTLELFHEIDKKIDLLAKDLDHSSEKGAKFRAEFDEFKTRIYVKLEAQDRFNKSMETFKTKWVAVITVGAFALYLLVPVMQEIVKNSISTKGG